MASAQDVLNAARSKLGVTESPFGSNRVMFNDWAGVGPGPWCAAFVSWALAQGGALDVQKFVYCPYGVTYYQRAGRWGHEPRIGAVIFFQWPNVGRPCHVGLVESIRADGAIVTIEGNTDEAGGGTGGKVMRQVRRAYIVGYGYPNYTELAPQVPATPVLAARPMIKLGNRGPNVLYAQKRLGAHRINPGPEDGIFGTRTRSAVIEFQRKSGLVPDGIVGPKTWAKLG